MRPVLADPTQIHQIAMNLVTNAYHAVEPTGGTISVILSQTALGGDDCVGTVRVYLPMIERAPELATTVETADSPTGSERLLIKPVAKDEMARTVRHVLDAAKRFDKQPDTGIA